MKLLIDLHYLPSLEYFTVLRQFQSVEFEHHEHYIKQSYRNRCFINTAQGVQMLVVPVTHKSGKTLVKDVRVEDSIRWKNNHWRTIESAYRKAPYYEHYADYLREILYQPHTFLFDLNYALLSFCLNCIKCKPDLSVSTAYQQTAAVGYNDMRSVIQAKIPYSLRKNYRPAPYYQIFGNQFVSNLSLVDLLFCAGPEACSTLVSSQYKE
ncbi:MAG: WbqC family protein [Cyclobacteriaceae bacterium]|nr:WbqC family protein [Cyclobacteriaceae bacterium]